MLPLCSFVGGKQGRQTCSIIHTGPPASLTNKIGAFKLFCTSSLRWTNVIAYWNTPWKTNMNLRITLVKRTNIFQTFIFGFHVKFRGCNTSPEPQRWEANTMEVDCVDEFPWTHFGVIFKFHVRFFGGVRDNQRIIIQTIADLGTSQKNNFQNWLGNPRQTKVNICCLL